MRRGIEAVKRRAARVIRMVLSRDEGRPHQLLDGYRATCLLIAAHRLGIFEALRTGSTNRQLAEGLGLQELPLGRVLRGLVALGMVDRRGDTYHLTAGGLRFAEEGSTLQDQALLIAEEYLPAWMQLHEAVMTGSPAFNLVFRQDVWRHRAERLELNDAFNRLMARWPRQTLPLLEQSCDFSTAALVIDVGGGNGELLSAILEKHPHLRGVVFDQSHVAGAAASTLEDARLLDRCDFVGGSFFESIPPGGDVYILRHILHDWPDDEAAAILRRCRSVMKDSTGLLIVENVIPTETRAASALVMRDLHMMAVTGGRERTAEEFTDLLRAAGLGLVGVTSGPAGNVIRAGLAPEG